MQRGSNFNFVTGASYDDDDDDDDYMKCVEKFDCRPTCTHQVNRDDDSV